MIFTPKKIYTGAARGARDKYEVCDSGKEGDWGDRKD